MAAFCINCGTPLPEGAGFCPKCGTKVEVLRCPACGKEVDFETEFCIYCGARLKEEAPTPEPKQEEKAPKSEQRAEEKGTYPPKVDPPKEEGWPDYEEQREFTWSQKKPQGRAGSAVTTVRVWLEREMLHIQKEFSDTITSHKNTLPEETIPLSEIEDVYTQKKGMSISVIVLLLCVALVIYGGVTGKFDLWTTVFCLLGLVVIIALRYRGQIKRYQLVIVEKNRKRIVLKGDDLQIMNEAAMTIQARIGSVSGTSSKTGSATPAKKKRGGLKIVGIILAAIVLVIGGIEVYQVLYVRSAFPSSVMEDQAVKDYVSTQINGDLDYLVMTDVTEGKLAKRTALPQKEDGLLTYLFVDYVYDITVTADNGESASGQVTVNCSFSTKPSESKPENIILNSFTYSDNLTDFISKQTSAHAVGNKGNVNEPTSNPTVEPTSKPTNEPTSGGASIYDMVGRYSFDGSFEAGGLSTNFYYSLTITKQDTAILIYSMWRGNYIIPKTVVEPDAFKDNVLTFSDGMEDHILEFIPASESAYGVNTIFLDGDKDMPYRMEVSFIDFIGAWREYVDEDSSMLYVEYSDGDARYRLVFPSGEEYTGRLDMDEYGNLIFIFGNYECSLELDDDPFAILSLYNDENGYMEYYFERIN